MKHVLLVGIGSFIGGAFRYLISQSIMQRMVHFFPFGTLSVNVIGCFLIGLVLGMYEKQFFNDPMKLFLVTGILGGFTTFSAFSIETIHLYKSGQMMYALIYLTSSVILGLIATLLGLWSVKVL